MSLDVLGSNFRAFELISDGDRNHGSVVMKGGKLTTVNSHYHFTVLNLTKTDAAANNEVRKALYRAITAYSGGKALSNDQLAKIRKQLGLGDNGNVRDQDIGSRDLTRREIKCIVGFVKEVDEGRRRYDEFRESIRRVIDQRGIAGEKRAALDRCLFGSGAQDGGIIKRYEAMFNSEIADSFSRKAGGSTKDNENPMSGRAGLSVSRARAKCLQFIDNFDKCFDAAMKKVDDSVNGVKQEASDRLGQIRNDLVRISLDLAGEVNEDRKMALRREIDEYDATINALGDSLKKTLLAKLANLNGADFENTESQTVANRLADECINGQKTQNDQKLTTLTTSVVRLEEDVKKVRAGWEAIVKILNETSQTIKSRFEAFSKPPEENPLLLRKLSFDDPSIKKKIDDALTEIVEIDQDALKTYEELLGRYEGHANEYTAENIEKNRKMFEDGCKQLVDGENSKIQNVIKQFNDSLSVQELPKDDGGEDDGGKIEGDKLESGKEDPVIASASKGEIENTKFLQEWYNAVQDFQKDIKSANDQLAKLTQLTKEQRTALDKRLDELQNQISDVKLDVAVSAKKIGDLTVSAFFDKMNHEVSGILSEAKSMVRQENEPVNKE